ncbi:murein L,D-transpeptidase catalytic domain family protein [Microvirga sp. STS02]|uniref:murein L,D-transpeptidase catalytic domain family protein n=1 Tax=Hymenobacter negativus TaxID=2795026 RepID=UPI0018DCDE43|nr:MULTISPECIES: murein L,D-transpeptidase catalytic domain family protein [Bacteria]MBH8568419.1 murein L,D-transpeptidase catalytic domain family protein [Hymenobacter negativus]MBR7208154.1 murein L,D-transpeptidase catalytic domain family protein [Microvirga sp. STS02]
MVRLKAARGIAKTAVERAHLVSCLAAALLTAGCQLRAEEAQMPAKKTVSAAAPITAAISPTAPATADVPDSLRLTPVPNLAAVPDTLHRAIQQLHAALGPAAAALRPEVLEQACVGYLTLHPTGRIERAGLLAVADMDLPNTTERLWVIDLQNAQVIHRSLVAHGEGSGHLRARRFSNQESSACTSLGFYRTGATYDGIHGYSRRIEGLDKGQNANAFDRYVVLHAADYASPKYIEKYGHLGYSRGCPALPPEQFKDIIATLRVGSMLLVSGPGLASRWLDGGAAGRRFLQRGWR